MGLLFYYLTLNYERQKQSIGKLQYIILASLNELTKVLGKPRIIDDPDSNFKYEWRMELDNGDVFAVYDWFNDIILKGTTKIKWHIGSKNTITAMEAREKNN